MDKDETKAVITQKLSELADEMAKLSCEILKMENAFGAQVTVDITNVMGSCKVQVSVQTSGTDSKNNMNEIIDDAVAAFKRDMGIPAAGDDAAGPVAKEDVDAALKEIFSKNKSSSEKPAADQPADQKPPDAQPPEEKA